MKTLSNKEIYVLLKLLNDKQANLELDKHFSLSEIERIQQEISITENKSPQEVFTIENLSKRMYGMEIQTGYRVSSVDRDSIIDYSNKYVEALIKNDLTGLADNNKLSVLIEEFSSTIKDKSNLTEYCFSELKYMPVALYLYTKELINITCITHNKYRLTNRDLYDNDLCFDESPSTIQTFSFKISADITKLDDKLKSRLNDFQNMFNEIMQCDGIISAETKTNIKQIQPSENNNKDTSDKQRKRFSPTSQMLYDYIKEHAPLNGYIVESIEICPEQDEQYSDKMFNNRANRNQAVKRLNKEYREIFHTDITLMKHDRLSNSYDISRKLI